MTRMSKYKYIILGAGPAGLSFANALLKKGETSFLVLESEDEAGGLCRTHYYNGVPVDIGGGHFLDFKRRNVLDFVFEFMPEFMWKKWNRVSKIMYQNSEIDYPFEANIYQMKKRQRDDFLNSIRQAGCNQGLPMPEKFTEWIRWKLGDKISNEYMIPYNTKMFGKNLENLGTYWLDKLPNVSYEDTLRSCMEGKPYGQPPAHSSFLYPTDYGYGELWLRMAKRLNGKIKYLSKVNAINCLDKSVRLVNGEEYSADRIIVTIPWTEFKEIIGAPAHILDDIARVKFTSVVIEYHQEKYDTKAQWVYVPDQTKSYHRVLICPNYYDNAFMGYWTETNLERFTPGKYEFYINHYAYPLNLVHKNEDMEELLSWMKDRNIWGLGRWGEWQHFNSDVVVERALNLADILVGEA